MTISMSNEDIANYLGIPDGDYLDLFETTTVTRPTYTATTFILGDGARLDVIVTTTEPNQNTELGFAKSYNQTPKHGWRLDEEQYFYEFSEETFLEVFIDWLTTTAFLYPELILGEEVYDG